jgi:hypothetical protein
MNQEVIRYRIYTDGSIAHEDDFSFYDHSLPNYDYQLFEIPKVLLNYIEAMMYERKQLHPEHNNSGHKQMDNPS